MTTFCLRLSALMLSMEPVLPLRCSFNFYMTTIHYLLKNHIIIYRKKGKKYFMQKYAWIKRYLNNRIIFRDIFVIIFLFNFMPFKETGIKDDFYTSCRCETETSRNLYFKFIKNWLININNIKYIFIRK